MKESAKLALLLDRLPELIEAGRCILRFPQFTSVLDFIAPALDDEWQATAAMRSPRCIFQRASIRPWPYIHLALPYPSHSSEVFSTACALSPTSSTDTSKERASRAHY